MRRREFLKHTASGGAALILSRSLPGVGVDRGIAPPWRPDFNRGWRFARVDAGDAQMPVFNDAGWEPVTLPHTARIEALVMGEPGSETYQWQGICWYRKTFSVSSEVAGREVYLRFEGAMNVADVWLNGEHLGQHLGGYVPFGFDISDRIVPDSENLLAVRLDNTDNPTTGPKPLPQLDFNPYHGLYRDVHLIVKDPLHITDPIIADKTAGGGVFVTFPAVSADEATVRVQVHVRNDDTSARLFSVHAILLDSAGRRVSESFSEKVQLDPGSDVQTVQNLQVPNPALWSPRHPNLYTSRTEILSDGTVVDVEETRIGIRRIEISTDAFRINGEQMFLRGTNRHQEYPYIGYALSAAAQYRDAKKIKEGGFDYVRLSHYLHAPAFMDACDELGLVVMNCIPGWQYFNREDPAFTELQYENSRRMLRRDRNHPCVILWEASLNETWMPEPFIQKTHAIAHEEYPGDQCYTCGWQGDYDVFIQARQHGGCREITDRPCVISEYGDWEYYAHNAGLSQETWADLSPDEANSRQLRWHGERAMLQQATNFQEAHNDNLKTIAFADGLWVMYDYNRGYAPDIESSGCMDLFRLPKFSYYFFQSQRDPDERLAGIASGPMVFIASYWTPESPTEMRVFSNCQEVALHLNGRLIERRFPDNDRLSTHLNHPPFTFQIDRFAPGTLEAVGYIDERTAARHIVRTPRRAERLDVWLDQSGRAFACDGKDMAFVYGSLKDQLGTVVPDAWENVFFGSTGSVRLIGENPFSSDAGVAGIVVQAESAHPRSAIYALSIVTEEQHVRILSGAASAGGDVMPYEIRFTTDGSAPGRESTLYTGPITAADRIRATLFAAGEHVVVADSHVPKFRIAGSTAPPQGD